MSSLAQTLTTSASYLSQSPTRLRYAVAMASRVAYFLIQGVGLSFIMRPQSSGSGDKEAAAPKANSQPLQPTVIISAIVDALLKSQGESQASDTFPSSSSSTTISSTESKPILSERSADEQVEFFSQNFAGIIDVLRRDMINIDSGVYKFPHDLDPVQTPNQWNPISVANMFANFFTDRQEVLRRRDAKDGLEIRRSFSSPKYPQYYLQNFHYQSDGWLSDKSAKLYDYQVESLFLGTADAMRRNVLPSFVSYMKSLNRDPSDVAVLDIASGTGKFASFIMDNYRTLNMTIMDLSPFYVARARQNLNKYETVKFVESPAETMPFPDASFDALTCVYLFHELPNPIRRKVVGEMFRVLKPNGKLFFVDSAQRGDIQNEEILEGFTVIAHEPYYLDYVKTDLKSLFTEGGFVVEETSNAWVSKSLTLRKPEVATLFDESRAFPFQ